MHLQIILAESDNIADCKLMSGGFRKELHIYSQSALPVVYILAAGRSCEKLWGSTIEFRVGTVNLYLNGTVYRLDFRRSLMSGLRPSPRRERGLLSRTAAGDRAYTVYDIPQTVPFK